MARSPPWIPDLGPVRDPADELFSARDRPMKASPEKALAPGGRHTASPRTLGSCRVMWLVGWLVLSLLVGTGARAATQGDFLGSPKTQSCAGESPAPSCCLSGCSCCGPAGPMSCPCAQDKDPEPSQLPWAPAPSSHPEAGGLGGVPPQPEWPDHPRGPACESTAPRPASGAANPWARRRAGKARARLACWQL